MIKSVFYIPHSFFTLSHSNVIFKGTRHISLSILFVFLLSAREQGCYRKSSGAGLARPATEVRSTDYLLKKLRSAEHANLQTMSAQAKVYFESDGQNMGVNANIIWIRDSVVWLNVKKFGLEAARALVTKDSVFILNRLEKTYSARGLESLQRQYSLPAGFDLVESLILGNSWLFPDITLDADIKEERYRLSGSNGRFSADYRIQGGTFLLGQEMFVQPRDVRTVSVSFENYKKNEVAGMFPYLRTLEAFSPESGNMRLSIELNDVEFNVPKSFRFEIPPYYEKVE